MCGITGIFYTDKERTVDLRLLDKMTDTLTHRGPDDRGTYTEGNVGLGFRRLAIIDLSPMGQQPMCNEDGTIWIVFNGEIYNFEGLRRNLEGKGHTFKSQTDTETIIHAYEEDGTDCLDSLDGMFAFCIWDSRKRLLFLARDRFGIKPLHYYHKNGLFAFGSEMKAILPIREVGRDIDYQALWNYFSLMQIPAPQTIYSDIRKFLPAQAMVITENGGIKKWQYWDIGIEEDFSKTETEWIEELDDLFEKAMGRHLYADVPVGVFLSGGVDSSAVVAYASRAKNQPVKTFSVSFSNYPAYDESIYQKMVSDKFGTDHYEFRAKLDISAGSDLLLRECDEPFAISSAIPLYYLSKLASEQVKVVLSGDGGDELFAGYDQRYFFSKRLRVLDMIPSFLKGIIYRIAYAFSVESNLNRSNIRRLQKLASLSKLCGEERYIDSFALFSVEQKKHLFNPDITAKLDESYGGYYESLWRKSLNGTVNSMLYTDLKTTLADEMLSKVDRCTSMVSIEGRVPFLDKTFAEAAFRIPIGMKINHYGGKIILKRMLSDLLPREVYHRQKAGFIVPLEDWLKESLFEDLLNGDNFILRYDFVKRLVSSHLHGYKNWSNQLFAIYQLLKWSSSVRGVKIV